MANSLLTVQGIANAAIATLYAQTQMASLVHRDFAEAFRGNTGDTITIRKPATFTALEYSRTAGIVLQDVTEGTTSLTLDTILDVSFAITSEDWTMNISDFTAQFLTPAMEAISQGVDTRILAEIQNVTATVPATTPASNQLIDAGARLNVNKVPMAQRAALLDPLKAAEFLKDPLFHEADKRGDTVGLREAAIGRVYGFDTYMSQNVTPARTGVAFHRDAFALVARTLAIPRGVAASQAAVAQYGGLGIRAIYNYDSNKKQDVVSLDLLIGTTTLDPNKAVVLSPAA